MRVAIETAECYSDNTMGADIFPGSVRTVVAGYYGSAEFKMLDARTQHVRRGVLDTLCLTAVGAKTGGNLPFRLMEHRHIRKLRIPTKPATYSNLKPARIPI